jgi:hypothetical protein
MGITNDKYETDTVVKMYETIQHKKDSENGYIPTKLSFEPIEENYQGYYAGLPGISSESMNVEMSAMDHFYEM